MRDSDNPQPGDVIVWWPNNYEKSDRPAFGYWNGVRWVYINSRKAIDRPEDWTFVPGPYVHKAALGDVVDSEYQESLHIEDILVKDKDGDVFSWRGVYLRWSRMGYTRSHEDYDIAWPVTVLYIPEEEK